MVHASAIYQKTAKGAQSLATRDPALTPKLRSMLIMIDGKRSLDELAKVTAALGETQQLLGQLVQMQMVEAAAAPAPAPSVSSAPAPLSGVSLDEAKRFAVRRLTDLLGPTAEDLCLKIESARTAAELSAVIKRAEAVLREFASAETADSFTREMQSHRPA